MTTTPPVTFSYTTFLATFPEFSGLSSAQVQAYFNRATGAIVANSCTNPMNADGNLPYLIRRMSRGSIRRKMRMVTRPRPASRHRLLSGE